MPRARNLKPGFFSNEDLAECSSWARLCFAGLWTLADREGRLEDRPKRIKGELFRFDAFDVEPLLCELEKRGFIIRYEIDGGRFIQVSKFSTHQTPHYSEKPSVIKPPPIQEIREHIDRSDSKSAPGVDAASRGGRNPLNPDSRILTPDSLNPEPVKKQARKRADPPPDCPEGVDPQVWRDWVALRKAKRATVSQTALEGAIAEAGKARMSLEAFLRIWCSLGWQGLTADRLPADRRAASPSPEPEWRREQRERNEAFLGPAAAKRSAEVIDMEPGNGVARIVDRPPLC